VKFLKWFISLFKNNNNGSVNKMEPASPIPEIPTKEEVNNFPPKKEISDFKFVDSSHHHPDFDPTKYKAPYLSNKCTEGLTFVDKTHAPRKILCAKNKIPYSGYHFFRCGDDPIKQAEFYVRTHGAFELCPQVDFETEDGVQDEKALVACIKNDKLYNHLLEVERLTGKTPILYVNYAFAKNNRFPDKFKRFFAWFARYNSELGPIPLPWDKESTGMWQFTDKGLFDGFIGGNDVSVYFGKANPLNLP
jgi:lysozyme